MKTAKGILRIVVIREDILYSVINYTKENMAHRKNFKNMWYRAELKRLLKQ